MFVTLIGSPSQSLRSSQVSAQPVPSLAWQTEPQPPLELRHFLEATFQDQTKCRQGPFLLFPSVQSPWLHLKMPFLTCQTWLFNRRDEFSRAAGPPLASGLSGLGPAACAFLVPAAALQAALLQHRTPLSLPLRN